MTDTPEKKAHIIVVSNEKGGTGKSTIAMHLAVKLMQEGFSVATIDLDGRQGSLSKYIENRKSFCEQKKIALPIPLHYRFEPESNAYLSPGEREKIGFQIYELSRQVDAVIIDTPGTKNYLFEEAHKYADTVITPITDSLIDLNVIADIDFATGKVAAPGHYANYIWEAKKFLAAQGKPYLNWIVAGNKVSSTRSRNKAQVFEYLEKLSKLYGYRFCEGLKDRVIYRELFLEGLTVLDMQHPDLRMRMSLSHLAAKIEIKNLAEFICPE